MHERHILSFVGPADRPIGELNTTPLIDVMLVLLIMFIITIPVTTHKVPMDLPQGPPPVVTEQPLVHRLNLDAAGRISLDGHLVTERELPARLAPIAARSLGELHLRAEAMTPYQNFDRVLALVKRAGIVRMGMVGNERFAQAVG